MSAVAVTVAVAVLAAVAVILAVFAVLAVAVVVAVFLPLHVDAVDHGTETRQAVLAGQVVDEAEVALGGVVGPADVEADIGRTGDNLGIGHHADGGGVQNHVVVLLLQGRDEAVQRGTGQQLRGIWGHGTARQDVEIVHHTRRTDEAVQVGGVRGDQVGGDAPVAVGEAEDLVQPGLADVQSQQDDLLAQQGEAGGQVGRHEGLALAALGGGGEDDFPVGAVEHEEQVGAQAAEGFGHHVVFVLTHHDGRQAAPVSVAQGHVAHHGYPGQAFHVGTSLDAVAEETDQEDDAGWKGQAGHTGGQQDLLVVRRDGTAGQRGVDDLGVVGSGGQGDVVFLPFLEEHEVEGLLHALLALHAGQFTLLGGGAVYPAGVLVGLGVQVGLGDEQGLAGARYGGHQVGVHVAEVGREPADHRVLFGRGAQQAVALQHLGVVLADEGRDGRIVQTHVDRQHRVGVGGVVQVVGQVVDEVDLGGVLVAELFVARTFGYGLLGVAAQVGQAGLALEALQFHLGAAQLAVDGRDAVVDEAGGVLGNQFLVVVGVAVIHGHQGFQEVLAPPGLGVEHRQGGDGGGLARQSHREGALIARGYGEGRQDAYLHPGGFGHRPAHFEGVRGGTEGQGSHPGGKGYRQAVQQLGLDLLVRQAAVDADLHVGLAVGLTGQVQFQRGAEAFRVLGREVHLDGGGPVEVGIAEGTGGAVPDVGPDVTHGIADDALAAQDFHLVVDVAAAVVHQAQLLQVGHAAGTSALLVVLDEDGGGDAVYRGRPFQVNPASGQAEHHGQYEPRPVDEVTEEQGPVIGLFFLFLQ